MDDRMAELAERCEQATAEQQREILIEAWWAISGMSSSRERGLAAIGSRFEAMLDATAYLDAAMTLVPEGWTILALNQRTALEIAEATATSVDPDEATEWLAALRQNTEHPSYRLVQSQLRHGHAATAALALCAAALRARGSQHG